MTIDNQLNVISKEYIAFQELNYYFAVYEHDQGAVIIAVLLRTSEFKLAARAMQIRTFEIGNKL